MITKRSFLCLVLAVLLGLTLGACQTLREGTQKTQAVEETTEPAAKERIFRTSDALFQITADTSWKKARKALKLEDASLALAKGDSAYLALISEYRYNFADGLSGYQELVVKNMQDHIDEDVTSETEELRMNGHEALKTEIAGKVEGQAFTYVIYCVEVEDYYVQVICWSGTEAREEFAAEFDKIARSLMSESEASESEAMEASEEAENAGSESEDTQDFDPAESSWDSEEN